MAGSASSLNDRQDTASERRSRRLPRGGTTRSHSGNRAQWSSKGGLENPNPLDVLASSTGLESSQAFKLVLNRPALRIRIPSRTARAVVRRRPRPRLRPRLSRPNRHRRSRRLPRLQPPLPGATNSQVNLARRRKCRSRCLPISHRWATRLRMWTLRRGRVTRSWCRCPSIPSRRRSVPSPPCLRRSVDRSLTSRVSPFPQEWSNPT